MRSPAMTPASILVLAHEQQAAEVLGQLRAAGVDDDDRDAGGDRVLDRFR